MSEWWTYRLSDFLLFAPRTYYRLFELYNEAVWPLQLAGLAAGIALVVACWRGDARAARAACALLAACWLWVAWAFHLQRYATINWAAPWFAAAFATQALLLAGGALTLRTIDRARRARARGPGVALLLYAVLAHPWLAPLTGGPWLQAGIFGLAPDPTVLGTLGVLLVLQPAGHSQRRWTERALAISLWPIPVLWCLTSGATLWAMDASDAWLMPLAAVLVVTLAWRGGRTA